METAKIKKDVCKYCKGTGMIGNEVCGICGGDGLAADEPLSKNEIAWLVTHGFRSAHENAIE